MGLPISVSASSSASGKLDQAGNAFDLGSSGDWSVNVGGSGTSYQSASGGGLFGKIPTPLLIVGALVAAWYFLR